jgi:hypothetical protein
LTLARKLKDTEAVVNAIIHDPTLLDDLFKPSNKNVLHRMVDQLVRDVAHNTRNSLLRKTHPAVASLEDAAKRKRGRDRAHAGIRESAMDWPIWGGIPIRKCTREDIKHSIAMRQKQMDEGKDSIRVEKAAVQLMVGTAAVALFGDVVSERAFLSAQRDITHAVAARR